MISNVQNTNYINKVYYEAFDSAEGTTTKALTLGQVEKEQIFTLYMANNDWFAETGHDNEVFEIGDVNVSFAFAQGTKIKPKTQIGAGTPDKWTVGERITVSWQEPWHSFEALPGAVVDHKLPHNAAYKTAHFNEEVKTLINQQGFKMMADEAGIKKEIDFEKTDGLTIARVIEEAAVKLMTTKDQTKGYPFGVPRDLIRISISPKILSKIANAAIIGNRAAISFEQGGTSIRTLGGFVVRENTNLPEGVEVMIYTTGTTVNARKYIASSAGKVHPLTNDFGVYNEAQWLAKVVKPNYVVSFKHKANAVTPVI